MNNPVGTLISELRTAGIASQRIRGGESDPGDAKEEGSFQRYVVLVHLGYAREHRAPIAEHRIGVRAYGATFQDAAVAKVVASVDARRVAYIASLLVAAGVEKRKALDRAAFLYWAYLGQAIVMDSRHASIAAAGLDEIVGLFEK